MANILVYSSSNALLGFLEGAKSLVIERRSYQHDKFTLTMSMAQPGANLVVKGNFLAVQHDTTSKYLGFRIDQTQIQTDDNGLDTVVAQGREAGAMLDNRIVEPPAGLAYDVQHAPAETAMKHYVTDHASAVATNVNRRLTNLTVVSTLGRGTTVHVQGRYQTVAALLEEMGTTAGVGWEFRYDTASPGWIFDTIHGTDRSATVTVDITLDSARAQKWLSSDANVRNAAIVAGQGEGVARQIVKRYLNGVEPTGWNRREMFVDARDLNDAQALQTRGDASISEAQADDIFGADIYAFGSFRYLTDWDLGDIVTVRNAAWGLSQTMRIISVTITYSADRGAEPAITVELDQPWPTLADQDKSSERSTGGASAHGAVDYHSESHAARHATGQADALTPAAIGAAALVHAARHASAGADPVTPAAIGAAPTVHSHTIVVNTADITFGALSQSASAKQKPTAGDQNLVTTFVPTDITGCSVTFNATGGAIHIILAKGQGYHSVAGGRLQFDVANGAGTTVAQAPFVGNPIAGADMGHTIVDVVSSPGDVSVTYKLRFMNVDAGQASVRQFGAFLSVVELKR